MAAEFLRLVQTLDKFNPKDSIALDTVFRFLNMAQEEYVKQQYIADFQVNGLNLKKFEDLRQILEYTTPEALPTTLQEYAYAHVYTLPDNYLFYVRSESKVERTFPQDFEQGWMANRMTTLAELEGILQSGFNDTFIRHPLIMLKSGNELLVYRDRHTTINLFRLMYLRYPKWLTDKDLDVPTNIGSGSWNGVNVTWTGAATVPAGSYLKLGSDIVKVAIGATNGTAVTLVRPVETNGSGTVQRIPFPSQYYTYESELALHTHEEILSLAVQIYARYLVLNQANLPLEQRADPRPGPVQQ